MRIIDVDIRRNHEGATVEEVSKAFNVGKGMSTLLGMALDPEHRSTVEQYVDVVQWKLQHTEGMALDKWRAIAVHLWIVLAASKLAYDRNARKASEAAT